MSEPARPMSRRAFFRNLVFGAAVPVLGGTYATQVEPFWVEYHTVPMPVRGLPEAFRGFRIAHLTDLHSSGLVPIDYIRRVAGEVNDLKPDLVVVTGDLVTDQLEWVDPVCRVLASLKAPTIVSLGNHDYAPLDAPWQTGAPVADAIVRALDRVNIPVLRNRAWTTEKAGARLWFVGLEDLFSGRFRPDAAFAQVPKDTPVICLSHNPDTAPLLDAFAPSWILAGHTHGGQVRLPLLGAPILPVQHRQWDQGLFQLPHSRMYVSRGVGYLRQIRFLCRPEVPIFELLPESAA